MKQIHYLRKGIVVVAIFLFSFIHIVNAKTIYKPSSFGGMDLNNDASKWCYSRSKQSDNFIVFWESGYGTDPSTVANVSYRVNVDALLYIAETSFEFYRDSLRFINQGSSKSDTYKMIILLYYSTTWQASGSGVDDMIGLLSLSSNAAQALGVTVAHEVAHCFQYQVHCDGFQGGWMYGFGVNGAGGNCWWEQCAQWQAFKVLPDEQFSNYNFGNYLNNTHKHLHHETPRYANYFIQDYWSYLHGMDFIGKLWQQSKYPEDPVEAYKRITQVTQSQFNDQIYDCASRFITWDVPSLKKYGDDYIDARQSPDMTFTADSMWLINSSACLENYGYNAIKLNVPESDTTITVYFEGKSGATGFRNFNKTYAGWRYGIVALLNDGSRVYSEMRKASYNRTTISNPKDTLTFECPANCSRLWLVVTGAPLTHWRHAWDDDDSNDEQWPYQVKFDNTNLYGVFHFNDDDTPYSTTLNFEISQEPFATNANPYPYVSVLPDWEKVCRAFCLSLSEIKAAFGSSIKYCAVNPNGTFNYASTANAPGHWFSKTGYTTNWGSGSYIFSEYKPDNLIFNIGQYPNVCKNGDKYTISQALVYTPASGPSVHAKFVFKINIETPTAITNNVFTSDVKSIVKNTIVDDVLYLTNSFNEVFIYSITGSLVAKAFETDQVKLGHLTCGVYIVTTNGKSAKIVIH
ncbi:MAG: DUF4859 domain-containing protein [Marinilabiliaceae bacterium]|nr:DUF4859 domain-containing protein [Marinilabiliaceae bacterium]